MAYYKGIVNHETPLVKSGIIDEVDRVMIEMGVPLQQPGLDWNFDQVDKTDGLTYAPVDEDTRQTLKEIQVKWTTAHKQQDFEKLQQIGKDIKTLLHIGNEILRLKRALAECTRTENFDKAIDIRNEILKHQSKRENFEVVYETSKFEDMLVLGEPSEQFKEQMMLIELEEHQRMQAIQKRKQDYEEEQDHLRMENARKQRLLEIQDQKRADEMANQQREKEYQDELRRQKFDKEEHERHNQDEFERQEKKAQRDREREQMRLDMEEKKRSQKKNSNKANVQNSP